ncbi:GlxA family transcriptional regulator [Neogemmobacter tilapiae]|uniref:AraC family transcriptional regulator n=1 Tax=Neogemmobacter tilapiae TaxID=875041 RepID=A0A918TS15_9RHOB|nr:helix-turn-helix domain-containing protein [Gemmobacter tilapiae]GHC59608.1 AraC family transcriptional regulator [Gemmobacter tilapiae]
MPETIDISLLLYPECQMASVHGLGDMFAIANLYAAELGSGQRIRCGHWSADGAAPDKPPQVLIIPGRLTPPMLAAEAEPLAAWLRACHAKGTVMASVCVGAFLLGHGGLLDGRRATTHWFYTEAFEATFPRARLTPEAILVEDGDILTAAGMMAWTDLGLRLIHRFLGPTVMAETARFLLVDPAGREQRHYSHFAPRLSHGDAAILRVQHWLQARGGREVSIPAMAAEAGLEPRTFLRRFQRATGHRPTEYVQHLRIGLARERLEFTRDPVDRIAWDVGYEDPAAFRRLFQRLTGLTASAYREKFATLPPQ